MTYPPTQGKIEFVLLYGPKFDTSLLKWESYRCLLISTQASKQTMTTLSGISTLSSRLSLLNDMFVLYSVQYDNIKYLRAINQAVQQQQDNYTSRSCILEKLCWLWSTGLQLIPETCLIHIVPYRQSCIDNIWKRRATLYIWRWTWRRFNNQNNVGLEMEGPETARNSVVAMETQVSYRIYQDGDRRFQ